MGLKGTVIPTTAIEFPGNDPLVVRGLDLASLTLLLREQRETLQAAFDALGAAGEGMGDTAEAGKVALMLAGSFPTLAGMVIACGCDEPEEWRSAMRLPISVQVAALEAIFTMTFVGEDALEKCLETVISVMGSAGGLLSRMSPTSPLPFGPK